MICFDYQTPTGRNMLQSLSPADDTAAHQPDMDDTPVLIITRKHLGRCLYILGIILVILLAWTARAYMLLDPKDNAVHTYADPLPFSSSSARTPTANCASRKNIPSLDAKDVFSTVATHQDLSTHDVTLRDLKGCRWSLANRISYEHIWSVAVYGVVFHILNLLRKVLAYKACHYCEINCVYL